MVDGHNMMNRIWWFAMGVHEPVMCTSKGFHMCSRGEHRDPVGTTMNANKLGKQHHV